MTAPAAAETAASRKPKRLKFTGSRPAASDIVAALGTVVLFVVTTALECVF